ncbi:CDP-glucose 4,6-dehydratase [Bradyrhizobium sp. AUGA SZCCT0274]|uniref:CDP-glucose 4,6-dehydratase n=1 Tax=Bradyrhizobium sp. AUGA SZCCT0274 TaxID=2807670 RepID=UPI001BA754C3|nr:CDP-glucose 4,6-dehydratase [Bradyrhizobium sp. AUGA SZCCT0274]MBR1244215.1 CDP-glucose 4,6-dehydratase [Bradyrhizobium sp. AUGA SZCCT0274]
MTPDFWSGRRVLLTGHTGFKGTWASVILAGLGAKVTAFSLAPQTNPSLWQMIEGRVDVVNRVADLRDPASVIAICDAAEPEIVLHMAAQAQVLESYRDPVGTFNSNVLGTVNLLEALRSSRQLRAILAITSDKVYVNLETGLAFTEAAPLGGADPYSASKGATEIAVKSYAESFFSPLEVPLATARGGNVIGGGDFSSDRLVPDLYRAARAGVPVELRYPAATRPWQHVLDCLAGYFSYVEYLAGRGVADPPALNFGPLEKEQMAVAEVAEAIGEKLGNRLPWRQAAGPFPSEKQALRLDCSLAAATLAWRPRLDAAETIAWTAQWYADFASGKDALELMQSDINRYCSRSAMGADNSSP